MGEYYRSIVPSKLLVLNRFGASMTDLLAMYKAVEFPIIRWADSVFPDDAVSIVHFSGKVNIIEQDTSARLHALTNAGGSSKGGKSSRLGVEMRGGQEYGK